MLTNATLPVGRYAGVAGPAHGPVPAPVREVGTECGASAPGSESFPCPRARVPQPHMIRRFEATMTTSAVSLTESCPQPASYPVTGDARCAATWPTAARLVLLLAVPSE